MSTALHCALIACLSLIPTSFADANACPSAPGHAPEVETGLLAHAEPAAGSRAWLVPPRNVLRYSISEPLSLQQGFTLVLLASASSDTGEQTVVSMQDRHGVEFQLFTRSAQFGVRGSGVQEVMFHDTYMWPRRESTRVDAYVFRASTREVSMHGFDMRGQYKRQSEVRTLDLANATFDSYFTLSFGSESFAGAFAKIYAEPNYESDDSIHGIIHQMFEYSRAHYAQLEAWYPFDGHLQNTMYRDERANVTDPGYRFVSGGPGNLYALEGEFSGKTRIMHPGTLAWNDPWTISAWVRTARASNFVVTDPRPLYVFYEKVPGSILDVQSMHGKEIGEIMIISLSNSSKCNIHYEPSYEATNGKLLVMASRYSDSCDPCIFIHKALELSPSGVLMLQATCSEHFTATIPIVQIGADKNEYEPSFETIYGKDVSLVQVLESKFRTHYPDGEENLQKLTEWYEPRPVKFYFHTDRTWGEATIGVCEGCTGAPQYNLTRETNSVPIMSVIPVGIHVSATNHHVRLGHEGQVQVPYVSQQWLHVAFVYGLDYNITFTRNWWMRCSGVRQMSTTLTTYPAKCEVVGSGADQVIFANAGDLEKCTNDDDCLGYYCLDRNLYFCYDLELSVSSEEARRYHRKNVNILDVIRYYVNGQLQVTLPFSHNESLDAMETHLQNCDVDDLRIYDSAIEPQHLPNTGMVCEAGMEGFGGDEQLACVPCSHGKYKSDAGNNVCLPCPQHKTTNIEGATSADECICAPGYIPSSAQSCAQVHANFWAQNGTNNSCPEFSSSRPGARSVDDCICNHGYEKVQNNTCQVCGTGKFNSDSGQECTTCYGTRGHECVRSTSGNSTACPGLCASISGYQVNAAGDGLEPCPVGTYNGGNGTNCTSCGVGYTSTHPGLTKQDQCTCDKGYTSYGLPLEHRSCVQCSENYYKPKLGLQKCKACADNEMSLRGQAQCDCVVGMYRNQTTDPCLVCAADTYKNLTGDQECTACADNATTDGESGQRACVCTAGFHNTSSGLCLPCAIAKYKTHAGNHSCTPCPDPQHTTLALASTLLDDCLCFGGYEPQAEDDTRCKPCNVSFYKNFSGNVQCERCADNVVTESTGSLVCACPRGQYKHGEGHCADCTMNFYKGYISDDFCVRCPNNSGTNYSEGAHSCMCNPGYFLEENGNCTACVVDDFKAQYGNGTCNDCPAREITSTQTASTFCECEDGSTKSQGQFSSCTCDIGYEVLTANILHDSCTRCAVNHGKPTISNNERCIECRFAEEVDPSTKACVCKAGRENDTLQEQCTCLPGFGVDLESQDACIACPVDSYRDGYQDAPCETCPTHSSTNNTTNNTICTCDSGYVMNNSECICIAGYERNETSNECQSCSVDFYKPGMGEDKCTKCPPRNGTNGIHGSVWCNHPGPNVVVDERGNYLCEEGFGVHEFAGPLDGLMCNNANFHANASSLRECEEACTLNSECKGFFWGLETDSGKVTYLGRDGKCALCSSGSLEDNPFTGEENSNYYKKKIPFKLMLDACEPCTVMRRVETPDGVHRICKFCPGNVCGCEGQNMNDGSGVCECAAGYQPDFFVEIQEFSAQCKRNIRLDNAKTLQECKHMCHMFTQPYASYFTDGIVVPAVIQPKPRTSCLTLPHQNEKEASNPSYHAWEGNLVELWNRQSKPFDCAYGFVINTNTIAVFCCRDTVSEVNAHEDAQTYYPSGYDPKQHTQEDTKCSKTGTSMPSQSNSDGCMFGYMVEENVYVCCPEDYSLIAYRGSTYYPPGYPQHAGSQTAAVVTEIPEKWQCLGLTWAESSQTCTLCGTTPPYDIDFQFSAAASTVFRFAPEYPPSTACSACPKDTAKPESGNHLCQACGGEGTTDAEGATSCTCAPGSNRTGDLCFCDEGYEVPMFDLQPISSNQQNEVCAHMSPPLMQSVGGDPAAVDLFSFYEIASGTCMYWAFDQDNSDELVTAKISGENILVDFYQFSTRNQLARHTITGLSLELICDNVSPTNHSLVVKSRMVWIQYKQNSNDQGVVLEWKQTNIFAEHNRITLVKKLVKIFQFSNEATPTHFFYVEHSLTTSNSGKYFVNHCSIRTMGYCNQKPLDGQNEDQNHGVTIVVFNFVGGNLQCVVKTGLSNTNLHFITKLITPSIDECVSVTTLSTSGVVNSVIGAVAKFRYRDNYCLWWQRGTYTIWIVRVININTEILQFYSTSTAYVNTNDSDNWIKVPFSLGCNVERWFPLTTTGSETINTVTYSFTGMLGWCTDNRLFFQKTKWIQSSMRYSAATTQNLGNYPILSNPVIQNDIVYFITTDHRVVRVTFTDETLKDRTTAKVTATNVFSQPISDLYFTLNYVLTQELKSTNTYTQTHVLDLTSLSEISMASTEIHVFDTFQTQSGILTNHVSSDHSYWRLEPNIYYDFYVLINCQPAVCMFEMDFLRQSTDALNIEIKIQHITTNNETIFSHSMPMSANFAWTVNSFNTMLKGGTYKVFVQETSHIVEIQKIKLGGKVELGVYSNRLNYDECVNLCNEYTLESSSFITIDDKYLIPPNFVCSGVILDEVDNSCYLCLQEFSTSALKFRTETFPYETMWSVRKNEIRYYDVSPHELWVAQLQEPPPKKQYARFTTCEPCPVNNFKASSNEEMCKACDIDGGLGTSTTGATECVSAAGFQSSDLILIGQANSSNTTTPTGVRRLLQTIEGNIAAGLASITGSPLHWITVTHLQGTLYEFLIYAESEDAAASMAELITPESIATEIPGAEMVGTIEVIQLPEPTILLCPADTYKDSISETPCTSCGFFYTTNGQIGQGSSSACVCREEYVQSNMCYCDDGYVFSGTACVPCEADTYRAPDALTCVACPDFSNSVSAANTIFDCKCNFGLQHNSVGQCVCPLGFEFDQAPPTCVLCEVGYYRDSVDNAECVQCPANSWANATGSSAKSACLCNAGFTGADGGPCIACVAGKYKNTTGSALCKDCGTAKYSAEVAAETESVCTVCPDAASSPPGSTVLVHCQCNEGYTGSDGGPCDACIPGTYKAGAGTAQCVACAAGKYLEHAAAISQSECVSCVENSHSEPGSANATDCSCNAGYTGSDGGPCVACVAGKYKPSPGSSACLACDVGKFSGAEAETNASMCVECPAFSSAISASTAVDDCYCNVGYTGPHGGPCVACDAGKYKTHNGSALCVECDAGKYSSQPAQVQESGCTTCSESSHSPAGSNNVTECTCNMGYTGNDGGPCSACVAGTYKPIAGSQPCLLCATGKFSTLQAQIFASNCTDCPASSDALSGSNDITDCLCNAGFTGENGGACTGCVAGTYKEESGPEACMLCAPGKYSTVYEAILPGTCTVCPTHTQSDEGSDELIDCVCIPGYTGPDGATCAACVPGKYKNIAGNSDCLECSADTYSNLEGANSSAKCLPCPEHSQSAAGSSTLTQCLCNAGYTGPHGGPCVECQAGEYKVHPGSVPCSDCPAGKYSDDIAQTTNATCESCPQHTDSEPGSPALPACKCNEGYSGPDGGQCVACDAGKYKPTQGSTSCAECPINSFSPSASDQPEDCRCNAGYTGQNGDTCTACEVGKYKSIEGPDLCTACAADTYLPTIAAESQDTCLACPANTEAPSASDELTDCICVVGFIGNSVDSCTQCPPGTYASETSECIDCEAGKYSPTAGASDASTCVDCLATKTSSTGSSACVCDAGYSPHVTNPESYCSNCLRAHYKEEAGDHACTPCPEDTYSNSATLTSVDQCLPCKDHSTSDPGSQEQDCLCVVGYFSAGSTCELCPAGTYKDTVEITHGCVTCSQNSYSPVGASTCFQCPVHTTAPAGSTSADACQCADGLFFTPSTYSANNQKTCPFILEGYEWAHCDQALVYEQTCSGLAECLGYSCFDGTTILCAQTGDLQSDAEPILIEKTPGGCESCPVNTYVSDTGEECTSCPTHAVSPAGSPDITDCTCDLGYTGVDGGTCTACGEGQYKAVVGSAACVNCPSSSISPAASAAVTDCKCNAGYTGPDGGTCQECGAGTYKDSIGSTACENCPVNTYFENTAALSVTECAPCPDSSESIAGSISKNMCLCKPGFESLSVYQMHENRKCMRNGAFEEEIGYPVWYLTIQNHFTPSEPHAYMTKTCNEHPECAGYFYTSSDQNYGFCYEVTELSLTQDASAFTLYVKSPPTCQLCETGKYKSTTSNDLCVACGSDSDAPAGSTAQADCACNLGYTGPDGGPCSACNTGTYKSTTGSNICSTCPQFSISDAGSVSLQDCQCNAGYSGPDGGPCTACQPDAYSANVGATVCTTCPAFSSSPSASVAVGACVCNAGYTEPDGGACSACVAGTFKSSTGSETCTSCSVGETSLQAATSEDECFCDSGFYLGETTYSSTRDFTCTGFAANLQKPCTLSQVEIVFTQSCMVLTDCKAIACIGNYLHICYNVEESASSSDVYLKIPASCTACEAGTYKSDPGSAACTACPASTTSPSTSTSQNDCECNAGFTGPDGGSCTVCAVGKYKSGVGAEACASCPAFSTSPTGSTVVESCQCNAGYTGPDGSTCSPCAAGTYKGTIGSDACTDCSAGTYSSTLGRTTAGECMTCPLNSDSASGSVSIQDCLCSANYYFMDESYSVVSNYRCRSSTGAAAWTSVESAKQICSDREDCEFFNKYGTVLVICKVDEIEYKSGYTGYQKIPASCQSCPLGTFSVAGAQSADDCLCNAGYGFDTGSLECTQCEIGKYKSDTGNTDCTECPALSTSPLESTALTQCTCNAGYTGANGGSCNPCAAGTYKATTGSEGCSTCPSFSTSEPGSALLEECICDAGYGANTDSGLVCELCAAGKYSLNGICTDCPTGATSPVGSTSVDDCGCSAGYKAQGIFTIFQNKKFINDNEPFDHGGTYLSYVTEHGHESKQLNSDQYNADPNHYIQMFADNCLSIANCKGFQIANSYNVHINFNNENVIHAFLTDRDITEASDIVDWNVYLNEGAFECQACPENKYLNAANSECTACPAFSTSPLGSAAITDCQCNAGFIREGNSCIKVCAAGTYFPPLGILSLGRIARKCYNPEPIAWTFDHQVGYNLAVQLCDTNPTCIGFYRQGKSGRNCNDDLSASGSWCSSDLTAANDGVYCNDIYSKVSECIQCDAGKFSMANAQECTNCPAYSTSSAGSTCTCNAGYTGPDGGTCTACVAGKYKAVSGSAACLLCEEGKYQSSTGKTVCVDCDGDGTSPAGSDSSSDCGIVCPAGQALSGLGSCVNCDVGKYQPDAGQDSCILCDDGTYQDETGKTICKNCPANSFSLYMNDFSLEEIVDCECNAGYTGPDGGTCTACVVGKYKLITGAAACSNCPAGTYQSLTGQTGCLPCGANTQSLAGSDSVDDCLPVCAGGSHYDSSLDQCASCDVGKYQPTSGTQTNCLTCADGTYQDVSAQTVCKDCPGNSYSLSANGALDASTDCKCNVGYTGPDGGTCTACVAGKYKASTGSVACSNCASNTYQSLTGQTGCLNCNAGTGSPAGSDSASDCVASSCTINGKYPSTGWLAIGTSSEVGDDDEEIWCPTVNGYIGFLWYGTTLYCLNANARTNMVTDSNAVTTFYDANDC
jgi:hypothetical protein